MMPRTRPVRCAGKAIFFQATARGEEGMTPFLVCTSMAMGRCTRRASLQENGDGSKRRPGTA
ncbi:DNA-directed RNA polymerases II, IV and V subunit 9B-like [Panicum miliaceum]|uniref:DNA-directed RNA polymerases II, IV and V subunit 9B-like n=1 Tax=Panicum miliaceum TaxID=4540 RepID=A0A3L6RAJ5_PANMI|nr:DNA-directed RNA polymerases II, IV and V subunit 9B-like [Panicum miliaceum]